MEISLYLVSTTSIDAMLTKLLQKTISISKKALVVFETEEYMNHINDALWGGRTILLPHARAKDPYPEEQPILLSLEQNNLNHANYVFYLEKADFSEAENFERAFILANQLDTDRHTEIKKACDKNPSITLKTWVEKNGQWEHV